MPNMLLDSLEEVAVKSKDVTIDSLPLYSIAISAKRQADALEELVKIFSSPTNNYGETMAEAIGGNIERALRTFNDNMWAAATRK